MLFIAIVIVMVIVVTVVVFFFVLFVLVLVVVFIFLVVLVVVLDVSGVRDGARSRRLFLGRGRLNGTFVIAEAKVPRAPTHG
jgi:hypothetical protein